MLHDQQADSSYTHTHRKKSRLELSKYRHRRLLGQLSLSFLSHLRF